MHRTHFWLIMSLGAFALTAAASSWFMATIPQADGVADAFGKISSSLKPSEIIALLLIAAIGFVAAGAHEAIRVSRGPVWAGVVVAIGIAGALATVGPAELEFQRLFPNGGAQNGWPLGEARAEFLYANYAAALLVAASGFLTASLLLLAASARARSPRPKT